MATIVALPLLFPICFPVFFFMFQKKWIRSYLLKAQSPLAQFFPEKQNQKTKAKSQYFLVIKRYGFKLTYFFGTVLKLMGKERGDEWSLNLQAKRRKLARRKDNKSRLEIETIFQEVVRKIKIQNTEARNRIHIESVDIQPQKNKQLSYLWMKSPNSN